MGLAGYKGPAVVCGIHDRIGVGFESAVYRRDCLAVGERAHMLSAREFVVCFGGTNAAVFSVGTS